MKNEWIIDDKGNKIHRTALIHEGVHIGSNNTIGPYCVIGYAAEYKGKEDVGKVDIYDNNTITGHVTIDSGTDTPTIISNRCYIMKHAHVGHDSTIFKDVTISPGAVIGGGVLVYAETNIGINASIHQGLTIPQGCMIGMGAVITKRTELNPDRKYAGVPAKDIGSNIRD